MRRDLKDSVIQAQERWIAEQLTVIDYETYADGRLHAMLVNKVPSPLTNQGVYGDAPLTGHEGFLGHYDVETLGGKMIDFKLRWGECPRAGMTEADTVLSMYRAAFTDVVKFWKNVDNRRLLLLC